MEAYNEKQNFMKSWWPLWLVTGAVALGIPLIVKTQTQAAFWEVMGPAFVMIGMLLLFIFLNLQTRIDELGVTFSFSFFYSKKQVIKWDEVKTATVRKYDPIGDYGGWGNKKGWNKNKRVYNVSGNIGLELILQNGKSIMIGTKQPEKVTAYLNYLKTKYQLPALNAF